MTILLKCALKMHLRRFKIQNFSYPSPADCPCHNPHIFLLTSLLLESHPLLTLSLLQSPNIVFFSTINLINDNTFKKCSENASEEDQNSKIFLPIPCMCPFHNPQNLFFNKRKSGEMNKDFHYFG